MVFQVPSEIDIEFHFLFSGFHEIQLLYGLILHESIDKRFLGFRMNLGFSILRLTICSLFLYVFKLFIIRPLTIKFQAFRFQVS